MKHLLIMLGIVVLFGLVGVGLGLLLTRESEPKPARTEETKRTEPKSDPDYVPPLCWFASGEPAPDLDAHFQQTKGWIGGDGAYSVTVTPQRTLWFFSDTFVGTVKEGKRVDTKMVNNSVAVQEGQGKEAKFQFIVGGSTEKPEALFKPADEKGYFWLQGGALVGETLYLFVAQIEKTNEGGAFGFRQIGQCLCVISNPNDNPATWNIEQRKLPFTYFTAERHRSFGAAVLVDRDHLYIYGTDEARKKGAFPNRSLIVARAPLKSVTDFESWRFFSGGEWHSDVNKCEKMSKHMGSELSVSYLSKQKRYALVYTENGLSPHILAQTATTPWGPWTEAQKIYECPEMKDKKVFTYAAKAHPMLAGPDELVVSYVVNAHDFWSVFKDATLYWPRFIRVKITDAKP